MLFDRQNMDVNDIVKNLNAHSPAAVKKLGGRVHSYDESARLLEMRFDIDGSYCHSGDIVQGGFVAGMLDAAMAHVVFASEQEFVVVATLEINVSYLEMAKPGELRAIGRIVKLGKSIGFLEAELKNQEGDLLARATSTARVIRKMPGQ